MKILPLIRGLRRAGRSGQSMVEFALTLPLLLLVLCGIVDFGWLFSNKLMLDYCAREGARYGSINATLANAQSVIQSHVVSVAPKYMANGSFTVSITFTNSSDVKSGDVIVDVVYHCQTLTPITGIFTGGQSVKEESKCEMKVE